MLMTRMVCLALALLLDPMPQGPPPARTPDQVEAAANVVFVAQDKALDVDEPFKATFVREQDKTLLPLVNVLYDKSATQDQPVNFVWAFAGAPDDGLGASLVPAEGAVRAQLNLPEGQGVVVASVQPGGPAERVGLKADDILLTLAGKPLDKPEALGACLKESGEQAVELVLIRGGKSSSLRVKPLYTVSFAPAEPEKPELFIGVSVSPLDSTLRSQLPDLAADGGLVVTEVIPESPAAHAEVRASDIILKVNDLPLADFEALSSKVQSSEDQALVLDLVRGGKPLTIEVKPVLRPKSTEPQAAKDQAINFVTSGALAANGDLKWVEFDAAGRLATLSNLNNGQAADPNAANPQILNLLVSRLDSQLQQGQEQQLVLVHALEALTKANAGKPADGVDKRLDELAAQIKQLGDAVDELRQAIRTEKEAGAKGR